LTSALDGGEWSVSRPDCFTPMERPPGTHWIGGWVGPRAVLDVVVKRKIPSPRRESKPRTPIVQSVAGKTKSYRWANPFDKTSLYSKVVAYSARLEVPDWKHGLCKGIGLLCVKLEQMWTIPHAFVRGCVQKFPDWPPGARAVTRCSCIPILWLSLVSFATMTLFVASQRVFIVVSVYFIINSIRKLLDTPSYICCWNSVMLTLLAQKYRSSEISPHQCVNVDGSLVYFESDTCVRPVSPTSGAALFERSGL
jgi:hypothetical protein